MRNLKNALEAKAARLLLALLLAAGAASVSAAPGDVIFPRKAKEKEVPPATFSHWFHRIRFTCSVCHPDLFPMKEVAKGITHDAMTEGKFCAACHAGKISWAISLDNCKRCHVPQ